MGCEVPGADTEVLGLTVGVGPGAVAGVVEGDGRTVGFGVLVGVGVGVGVGGVDGDPEAGPPPDELLASGAGGLTLA